LSKRKKDVERFCKKKYKTSPGDEKIIELINLMAILDPHHHR